MTESSKNRTSNAVSPDQIIQDLGGCGRFQVRMSVVVHLIKTIVCFTFMGMVIISATPSWWCEDEVIANNLTSCFEDHNTSARDFCLKTCVINGTACKTINFDSRLTTIVSEVSLSSMIFCNIYANNFTSCFEDHNTSARDFCLKTCMINGTACKTINFDSRLTTIVSEFSLVCKRDFIPSTINSIQIAGTLVGNVASGQIADLIGRKPPFFSSVVLILVFNLVGYFSTSWQMFAVARFFLGMGGGFFLTTQYCFLSEFSLARWRVWIVGFPSWPIQTCVFSLLAWLLHDWRYIQLMTALFAVPCFMAWYALPESFRWYIAHDKPEKAENIIRTIAKYNKQTKIDIDKVLKKSEKTEGHKYTVLHLFKSRYLVKVTLLLALSCFYFTCISFICMWYFCHISAVSPPNRFSWISNQAALGIVSYGIIFGIQSLSGNIYLNLFLFSLTAIPSKSVSLWLQNRFGRKASSVICFVIVAIGCLIVAVVQTTDVPNKDELTNGFAIFANMGIAMAWGSVQTMTIELYPTVIRNIGFGSLSVTGRVGAILGPQLVYLNTFVPGLLYYVCGSISVICVIGLVFLPETMDRNLSDKIQQDQTCTNPDHDAETKCQHGLDCLGNAATKISVEANENGIPAEEKPIALDISRTPTTKVTVQSDNPTELGKGQQRYEDLKF